MNILDAAYATVHGYPGGAESLAPRMGKRPVTLCHEVRPPVGSTAKFGLLDALSAMELSGDYRILNAMAARVGHMVLQLPQLDESQEHTMQKVAALTHQFAATLTEIAEDAADNEITDNELARIEASWGQLQAVGQRLLSHLAVLNAQQQRRPAESTPLQRSA